LWSVLALLFVGCINVAGLLLARGVKREREMALRSAIGANRVRIIRQILTEALLFAFSGAAVGITLAYGLLRIMRLLLIAALSRGGEIEVNVPVLLVSLAIAIVITVLAAMIPALRLSGTAPSYALKSGGNSGTSRGQHRLRAAFVVTQVALALSLLVVSGLLMNSLRGLRNTDLGFSPDNIVTTEIDLSKGKYEGRNLLTSFYQPLLDRIHSIPGVQSAGTIQMLPIQSSGWNWEHIHIVGTPPLRENRTSPAEIRFITPGYYQVFQDRLIAGRLAQPGLDRPDTRLVAVVNEAFVKQFVPAGWNPIGLEIGDDQQTGTRADEKDPKVTIIGVVKNVRQDIYHPPLAELDYLIAQVPQSESFDALSSTHLVVRTEGDPKSIIPALRNAFHEVDPTLPFRTPQTMVEIVADTLTFERLENWLFGSFAGLAILLAIVGLYGLISHEVELSTRDIGVRLALGATRKKIVAGIYSRVSWMLGGGAVIGLALTMTVRKYINSVVAMEVEKDAGKILLLTGMLLSAGLLAALLPARRASSVDPMQALRDE
jgi:predicted permease